MASPDAPETPRTEPPIVKIQIGLEGYEMVLRFSTKDQAQAYYTPVLRRHPNNLRVSEDGLEVFLTLRKVRKIVLGKDPSGPFKIQFSTRWAAQSWHQCSNLSHLYGRKGRCVLIAESKADLWLKEDPPKKDPPNKHLSAWIMQSSGTPLRMGIIWRAESLLVNAGLLGRNLHRSSPTDTWG